MMRKRKGKAKERQEHMRVGKRREHMPCKTKRESNQYGPFSVFPRFLFLHPHARPHGRALLDHVTSISNQNIYFPDTCHFYTVIGILCRVQLGSGPNCSFSIPFEFNIVSKKKKKMNFLYSFYKHAKFSLQCYMSRYLSF